MTEVEKLKERLSALERKVDNEILNLKNRTDALELKVDELDLFMNEAKGRIDDHSDNIEHMSKTIGEILEELEKID